MPDYETELQRLSDALDRVTADIGEYKESLRLEVLENERMREELASATAKLAEQDERWKEIIADELACTMRQAVLLGVVPEVEAGRGIDDAMTDAIKRLLDDRAKLAEARGAVESAMAEMATELNLANYDHDDVRHLNDELNRAYVILKNALARLEGEVEK